MTPHDMRRAASFLELKADALERSHTVAGRWLHETPEDRIAKRDCDQMRTLAGMLRTCAELHDVPPPNPGALTHAQRAAFQLAYSRGELNTRTKIMADRSFAEGIFALGFYAGGEYAIAAARAQAPKLRNGGAA